MRELRNVVRRAFVMAEGEPITDEWLPANGSASQHVAGPGRSEPVLTLPVGTSMAEMERQLILATLHHCKQHKEQTAVMLGISMKTLYNRLREYATEPHPHGR
ncbi:helix-turn-helix domain-containing protein [Azohydromonas australica]|uniref:helix-turn-helix domain-containing protein n=1 Tax=Azohydromonas australica TaxID=364039 RepID=UPI000491C9D1|nr:helix-turn-helix domain-containing protein [Azohydromonas australica]